MWLKADKDIAVLFKIFHLLFHFICFFRVMSADLLLFFTGVCDGSSFLV